MMSKMDQWINEELSKILDFQVPDDLIQYILSIQNEGDLNEYMKTLLDFDNSQHRDFFRELVKRKFPSRGNSVPQQQKKKISKSNPQKDFISGDVSTEPAQSASKDNESRSKKKTKFINLYSQEGKDAQVVLLKGRHHCDCEASKHELVNNCLNCGRVVCKQEGSGPCLFCGSLVCTPEEQRELNAKTKSGVKLMETLMERNRPKGWEAALAHRNKLLEYDRNSESRTKVTDDDSDYFQANSVWLSASEREKLEKYHQELQEKKHASRLQKKMTFDFGGRQIIEDNTIEHEVDEDKIRQMTRGDSAGDLYFNNEMLSGGSLSADRMLAFGVNPSLLQFDQSVSANAYSSAASKSKHSEMKSKGDLSMLMGNPRVRVQDATLLEMSDTGRCLSMHQPWASLLIEGIKLHEGRTWYSSHRGRLWIASTAKPPDQELVRSLENHYRALYPDKELKFPSFYPAGCLLGCVNVDDCMPQEEYQKLYPGGESDSPYVFICSNPISLRLRFPLKGQHKIYTLDKTIHTAAVKCLQNMARMQAAEAKEL